MNLERVKCFVTGEKKSVIKKKKRREERGGREHDKGRKGEREKEHDRKYSVERFKVGTTNREDIKNF